jgi:hypothetical protein
MKQNIERRINELKREEFLINISDILSIDERNRVNEIDREIRELEAQLKAL